MVTLDDLTVSFKVWKLCFGTAAAIWSVLIFIKISLVSQQIHIGQHYININRWFSVGLWLHSGNKQVKKNEFYTVMVVC